RRCPHEALAGPALCRPAVLASRLLHRPGAVGRGKPGPTQVVTAPAPTRRPGPAPHPVGPALRRPAVVASRLLHRPGAVGRGKPGPTQVVTAPAPTRRPGPGSAPCGAGFTPASGAGFTCVASAWLRRPG